MLFDWQANAVVYKYTPSDGSGMLLILTLLCSSVSNSVECQKPIVSNFTLGPILLTEKTKIDCYCQNCDQFGGRVIWERNGISILNILNFVSLTNKNQTLTFKNPDKALAGEYKCHIINTCGSNTIPPVTVFVPELFNQMDNKIVHKKEGDPHTIECSKSLIRNVPLFVEYSVVKIGSNPEFDRALLVDAKLIFSYLTATDSALYRCQAKISDSTSTLTLTTEYFALYVGKRSNYGDFAPKIVYPPHKNNPVLLIEGQALCAFYGNPSPKVTYYDVNQREIEISSMKQGHSYICVGQNYLGTDWMAFTVVTPNPPNGSIIPFVENVTEGEAVTFRFESPHEIASLSWYYGDSLERLEAIERNRPLVSEEVDGSVRVNFTVTNGPTKITCVAENKYGSFLAQRKFKISHKREDHKTPDNYRSSRGKANIMIVIPLTLLFVCSILLVIYIGWRTKENKLGKARKLIRDHQRFTRIGEVIASPLIVQARQHQNNSVFI